MAQATQQQDGSTQYSFHAIVSADTLSAYLNRAEAAGLVELRLHIDEDGIWTKGVDPANISMGHVTLDASGFESYEANGGVVGLNIERMQEVLGIANSGNLVHLGLNPETRRLDVEIPSQGVEFEMALIDPDSIRHDPDLPSDLDLPAEIVLEASWLQQGSRVADMVSDHLTLRADRDAESVSMIAEGDTDNGTTTIGRDDLIDASVPDTVESMYSLDYLAELVKVFDQGDELTVELGDEFPVKIHFEYADGAGSGMFCLAPRIQKR